MLSERVARRAEYLYQRTLCDAATHLDASSCCGQPRSDSLARFGFVYFFDRQGRPAAALLMPRLFTGIELPEPVVAALALARGGLVGARWLEPADYHVTLRFIGDVDGALARDIDASLAEIRRPPVALSFEGFGAFGGDKPRALVARLVATAPLVELQAEQERRVRRLGVAPETRKYAPHVTLARLNGLSPHAVADYLGMLGGFAPPPFPASRFALFSAREGSGGGPYVVEAAYPLR